MLGVTGVADFPHRCNKPDNPFLSCSVTCFDGKDDIPHDLQGQASFYYTFTLPCYTQGLCRFLDAQYHKSWNIFSLQFDFSFTSWQLVSVDCVGIERSLTCQIHT